jgi:hypothetical protein
MTAADKAELEFIATKNEDDDENEEEGGGGGGGLLLCRVEIDFNSELGFLNIIRLELEFGRERKGVSAELAEAAQLHFNRTVLT